MTTKKQSPKESEEKKEKLFAAIQMKTNIPEGTFWLPVTSKKSGYKVFLPLPIRLIQQIPDAQGGGCIVRGYYGDECITTENIVEVLRMMNGAPLGEGASCWEIAT